MNITEIKAELLSIFYENSDRAFYMSEIGRIIGKKPGAFQRPINELVKEGLLNDEFKANSRFFTLNKEYSLYEEVRNLILKITGLKKELIDLLKEYKEIATAFIFGSYAKGKMKTYSDIDIILVGRADENILVKDLEKLENKYKRELNYKLLTWKELVGLVKAKDPFILNVLSDNKEYLKGGENELRTIYKE